MLLLDKPLIISHSSALKIFENYFDRAACYAKELHRINLMYACGHKKKRQYINTTSFNTLIFLYRKCYKSIGFSRVKQLFFVDKLISIELSCKFTPCSLFNHFIPFIATSRLKYFIGKIITNFLIVVKALVHRLC